MRQGSCPSLACFPEPSFAANEDGGGKQTAACFLVSPDGLLPLPAQSLSAGSNTGRPSDRHPPGRRRRRRGELWQLSLIPGRLRGAGPSARAIERDPRPLGRRAAQDYAATPNMSFGNLPFVDEQNPGMLIEAIIVSCVLGVPGETKCAMLATDVVGHYARSQSKGNLTVAIDTGEWPCQLRPLESS